MTFKGFSSRDPTMTEQRRLSYARQLNKVYRAYSKDTQAIIKAGPDLKTFVNGMNAAGLKANNAGDILAKDLVDEAYKSGMYRADVVSGSILNPTKGTGPGLGITGTIPGMLGPANIDAVEIMTTRMMSGITGMTADLEKKVKFVFTDGMMTGKGSTAMAREVAKVMHGDLWKAQRIVRTEYINAHNQAAFTRYQDYGFTHYSISVEDCEPECDICPPLRGRVFKFGSGPVPPLHPNCRCSIYPVEHKEAGKIPEKKIKRAVTNKAVQKAIKTSENSIRKNKYETAKIFDPKTGKTIKSIKGTKNTVSYEGMTRKDFQGKILTHNHPQGTSFSPGDIKHIVSARESELRACTQGKTYILRVTNDAVFETLAKKNIDNEYTKLVAKHSSKYANKVKSGNMSPSDANVKVYSGVNKEFFKGMDGIQYIEEKV